MTNKEKLFIQEFLKDLNGAGAAVRAGYAEGSASVTACKLLAKANVSEAVQVGMALRAKQVQIDAHMIVTELKKIVTVDITQAYNLDGSIKPFSEMPPEVRASIAGVTSAISKEGVETRTLKFHNKVQAAEVLGKHIGMFTHKLHLTADLTHQHREETEEEKEARRKRVADLLKIHAKLDGR